MDYDQIPVLASDSMMAHQDLFSPVVDGEQKAHGLEPRDWRVCPMGSSVFAPPFDLPLIPESEWEDRLRERIAQKAQLSDLRMSALNGQPIPSLDQNGQGYCWAYSTGSALLMVRALNNQPYVRVSPHGPACMIKGFRDQGGWNLQSMEWAASKGYPSDAFWPQKSMSRSNDRPETWENAKLHRVTEWMELADGGEELRRQMVTCLLLGIPVVTDFNWWGHSVCTIDLVSLNPFKTLIWNSWGDSWSNQGMGILEGSRAMPNGAVAPRVLTAATV